MNIAKINWDKGCSTPDYYPFGMEEPGRNFSLSDDTNFRYGFNGQERDDDIEGKGDLNTAMFWEYDTRLGVRWNPDPESQFKSLYASVVAVSPFWRCLSVSRDTVK